MATAPTLPRMVLADKALDAESLAVANKAAEVLSYTVFGSLLTTLCQLDIHPLDKAAVEQYKLTKVKVGMWRMTKVAILLSVCFVMLSLCTAWYWSAIIKWGIPTSPFTVLVRVFGVGGSFIVFCAIFAALAERRGGEDYRKCKTWSEARLEDYQGQVPLFVLSKALAIREAYPNARFTVEQLAETTEQGVTIRDPDPFLIVKTYQESYYVDVWDERQFENKL